MTINLSNEKLFSTFDFGAASQTTPKIDSINDKNAVLLYGLHPDDVNVITAALTCADAVIEVRGLNDEIGRPQLSHYSGVLILDDQSLEHSHHWVIQEFITGQPIWSDLPILVLASGSNFCQTRRRALNLLGKEANIFILERPLHSDSILATTETALRARRKQFEMRDELERRKLRESEEIFSKSFHHNPAAMAISRTDGRILDVNDSWAQLFGIPREEAIGRTAGELDLYENPSLRRQFVARVNAESRVPATEIRVKRRSGEIRTISASVETITIKGEKLRLTLIDDITERRHYEEALRIDEKRYRAITQASSHAIWKIDFERNINTADDWWSNFTGIPLSELENRWTEAIHPDDRGRTLRTWATALAQNSRYEIEYRVRNKAGDYRHVACRAVPIEHDGRLREWFGTFTDVTEQKQADLMRRHLAAIVESSQDAILASDLKGNVTSWNQGAEKMFGYTSEEMSGHPIMSFVPEKRHAEEHEIINRLVGGEAVPTYETVRIAKNGRHINVALTVSPIHDSNGEIIGASKILRDISERKRAEAEIARFKFLVENSTEFVGMCDLDGKPNFVNSAGLQMVGLTASEITKVNVPDFFFPEDRELIFTQFFPKVARENQAQIEIRFKHFRTGEALWMIYNVMALRNPDGAHVGYATISQDITERKAVELVLRNNEQRLNLALDAVSLGSWELTIPAFTLRCSHQCKANFGRRSDERLTYEDLLGAIHPDDVSHVQRAVNDALAGDRLYQTQYRINWPDGTEHWIAATGRALLEDGKTTRMIGVTEDITNKKSAEIELQRMHHLLSRQTEDLEKLVAKRTASLKDTTDQLETFCYTVAHDLRGPLRAQQGFAYALLEEYGLLLDETGKDYLQRIITSASRLNQLVTDLLAYSRLGREELVLEKVPLGEIIGEIVTAFANPIRSANANVTRQKRYPSVLGHSLTLHLSLENLLSNALKFVKPGVKPRVQIATEMRGDMVRIWIIDNGIGIAPEHQTQIFGVFHRLHTKAYPGTGIGLALVDKAVQRMGGKIGVESERDKGSRFWIELPLAS